MSVKGKNYAAEFCGSLPLHNINLIQPYGYLLVIDKDSLSIIQTSENIELLLGAAAKQIVNTKLDSFIDSSAAEDLIKSSKNSEKFPLNLRVTDRQEKTRNCIAIIHVKPEFLIMEIEEIEMQKHFIDIFQEINISMAAIEEAGNIHEVCNKSIKELKKLSGFNKVMMYQFDDNWNGTVVAEVSDEGLDPYLGLTFPASDIPKQARDLYLKNPYRLIPTRDYTPVRLYPVRNPVTNSFIDLSDCNLRSVPAVHLEYLENMDVMASMSTRVIINGQLWGLISCHHKEEKHLSYEDRAIFDLLSNVISAKISAIQNEEKFNFKNLLREKRIKLTDQVYSESSVSKGLLNHDTNIMDLLNSDGAVVVQNGIIDSIGKVPAKDEIRNLVLWLQKKGVEGIYAESNLTNKYDHAEGYTKIGSGIVAIPINQKKGDYVIAFRPEVITTVNWGGNPEEVINFESDGKKYHPRNSFRLWKETVVKTSLPWHTDEIAIAEQVRSFIFEFSSKYIYN